MFLEQVTFGVSRLLCNPSLVGVFVLSNPIAVLCEVVERVCLYFFPSSERFGPTNSLEPTDLNSVIPILVRPPKIF